MTKPKKTELEELDDWAREHCETCGERLEDCDEMRDSR